MDRSGSVPAKPKQRQSDLTIPPPAAVFRPAPSRCSLPCQQNGLMGLRPAPARAGDLDRQSDRRAATWRRDTGTHTRADNRRIHSAPNRTGEDRECIDAVAHGTVPAAPHTDPAAVRIAVAAVDRAAVDPGIVPAALVQRLRPANLHRSAHPVSGTCRSPRVDSAALSPLARPAWRPAAGCLHIARDLA